MIIPSFAVGRVEELLYWLRLLERSQQIPTLPVCVDSPDGGRCAAVLRGSAATSWIADMRFGERDVCTFGTERMTIVASPQESMELVSSSTPAIVIAASGMATGGRVLHHLAAGLPDSEQHRAVCRVSGRRHPWTLAV